MSPKGTAENNLSRPFGTHMTAAQFETPQFSCPAPVAVYSWKVRGFAMKPSLASSRLAGILLLFCALFFSAVERSRAGGIIEFPIPTVGCEPESIVVGPDGAYWFVEFQGQRIGRI